MEEPTETAPVGTESANEGITDNQTQEVVTEPAKTGDTGNQEGQETGTEQVKEVSNEPQPYSYEELQNVKTYTELDPSRLPKALADAVNASKTAQGELTKLQQRLSAQDKAQSQPRPSEPKQAFAYDVFQAFDIDNYAGVNQMMGSLSDSIERRKFEFQELQFTDHEKAAQVKQNILADMEFKSRLDQALAMAYQDRTVNGSLYNDVDTEIFKAMPNFKEIAPEIGQFAMKSLNFSQNTIEDTMDAKIYIPGLMKKYGISQQEAAKRSKQYVFQLTKGMHDIYLRISGKGLQNKANRIPPATETGGGGNAKNSNTNLKVLHDKAMKTHDLDDLAKYYSAEAAEREKSVNSRR